ncbi:MAG: DNA repair protein RecO [Coprobacillus sp.]|nr:DNA repair protein RecO [Coprobacillus sp.]
MDLIILSINHYKEKDAVITAISEKECFSFLAKGVFNERNIENNVLNTPCLEIDASFLDNKQYKHPVLKEFSIIHSPLGGEYSLSTLLTISFLGEVSSKILPPEEMHLLFLPLKECLSLLSGEVDYDLLSLIYLFIALSKSGYCFEVNQCVNCGSKEGIYDFSFDEGGLLCKDCISKRDKREFEKDEILVIRYIVNHLSNITETVTHSYFEKETLTKILNRAVIFASDSLGVTINSFKMMKKA